ncbi:MAG TPA: alpha/beta hydrolase [Acidimicrobiaceae bacterium]|nr:alpha/beta hydrolase [Acidimicrobiaceae bacterium]
MSSDHGSAPHGIRLPPGRRVELPGRGTTFVRELPGPPGAPTIVLLHGWTVSADLNWFACYEALGRRYRVLAIDHRGHGRGLRSRRRFRLADCADDVAALCRELGIRRITPVGYSMGGPIALLTWHRHRELVDSLVLCATAPYFRTPGTESAVFSMLPVFADAARFTPLPVRRAIAARLLGRRLDQDPFGQWARQEIGRGDPAAIAGAGASLGRFDARPWLADIDVPVSVVRTTRDQVVSPARQTELHAGIPGAQLVDVAADHAACVTGATRFVPALLRALRHVHTESGSGGGTPPRTSSRY